LLNKPQRPANRTFEAKNDIINRAEIIEISTKTRRSEN